MVNFVFIIYTHLTSSKLNPPYPTNNSVALVRERTIPNERPPLIGEISDNFCG
jgi:hypothetical protein